MRSCALLEQPGKWRVVGIALGLLCALVPSLTLLLTLEAATLTTPASVFTAAFAGALRRGLTVALAVMVLSMAFGLPTGVVAGLYDFPLRRLLLVWLVLPLLVPSFIIAIGLSMLRIALGFSVDGILSGFSGVVLAFTTFGVPLVTFITLASVRGVSRSQADAARLSGGERYLFWRVTRNVFPAAALTSVFAGILTLSEPGPGQILGHPGVATEILISFAAQYDFILAARQCSVLAGVVCVLGLPIALLLAPRLATGLLARDVMPIPLTRVRPITCLGPVWLLALLLLIVVLPFVGFAQPLFRNFPAGRALQEVGRTLGYTMFYGLTASFVATVLGIALAFCAGRSGKLRVTLLAALLLLFALPPAHGALGWIQLASISPIPLDPVLRGSFTVGLALALRFFPIATLFALRSFGATSPSWANVAAIHGVPPVTYFRKVLAPWLAGALAPAATLIVLLALADVGSVLLLHPPGKASLPLAIFTIMANAPESLVGALCLLYVTGAAILLALALLVARWSKGKG